MLAHWLLVLTPLPVPFWQIAHKLEYLTILFDLQPGGPRDQEEHTEAQINAVRAPWPSPLVDFRARRLYHSLIASRTILAAARGGQLRWLRVEEYIQHVFAVRALLSCWVRLDYWHERREPWFWAGAAASLRPLLAHASLWFSQTRGVARTDRYLTLRDLQLLQKHFQYHGTPEFIHERNLQLHNVLKRTADPQPVHRYLAWFAEDAELAQQVADAWTQVVDRGGADKVKCPCERCTPPEEA